MDAAAAFAVGAVPDGLERGNMRNGDEGDAAAITRRPRRLGRRGERIFLCESCNTRCRPPRLSPKFVRDLQT